MSEYEKLASSAYTRDEGEPENVAAPAFCTTGVLVIEADNPGLGTAGDICYMFPGREGLITLTIDGGPAICTAVEKDTVISFPDPCSWLGANLIHAEVTNDFGTAHVDFHIVVQDNMGFCGP